MNACDKYIDHVNEILPELARTKDLIHAGIYQTEQAASAARRRNQGPAFFKINDRVILYPKNSVIDFLKKIKQETKE